MVFYAKISFFWHLLPLSVISSSSVSQWESRLCPGCFSGLMEMLYDGFSEKSSNSPIMGYQKERFFKPLRKIQSGFHWGESSVCLLTTSHLIGIRIGIFFLSALGILIPLEPFFLTCSSCLHFLDSRTGTSVFGEIQQVSQQLAE